MSRTLLSGRTQQTVGGSDIQKEMLDLTQRLALLGHELQHALEVAGNPGIRDRASFLQYYEQVGIRHLDPKVLDTEAARQTGERVKQELAIAGIIR